MNKPKPRRPRRPVAFTVPVSTLALAVLGCALALPAAASRIVYLAEQDHAYVNELHLADLASPGVTTKLNRSLSLFSEGVSRFAISPDGSRIVYSADQDTAGDPDLYLVDITRPGTWTRLGSLPAGHRELHAKFSPDGSKVAFTASDAFFAGTQLYLVDLAAPATATRLNAQLADQGAVSISGFDFTPDGSRLVYVAGELESKFELYSVDIAAPGKSVRLNAPGGSVGDSWEGRFRILPDGNRVVYSAVWQNPRVREVHLVSVDAPGQPVTLNAALQPNGYVFDFALSPDGRYVTYTADQETDSLLEVYAVSVDAPGVATKINGPVQYGAGLARFTPDSQSIIYAGDEAGDPDERDLYRVWLAAPANRVRLNAPLQSGESVSRFAVSADGAQLVYRLEGPNGFSRDLMLVQLDAPGSALRVNGPLPNGALDFTAPLFSPDGREVAFLAVESLTESIQELFFARIDQPGTSVRLNGPLPPEGIVAAAPDSFAFLPAGAPPTGSPGGSSPPGNSPPGGQGGASGDGGGGAMDWLLLLLLLTAKRRMPF